MIIDTHAHLNDDRLIDSVENIIKDMHSDGLEAIINVGYDLKSSEVAFTQANIYENLYATIGIHPHDSARKGKKDYEKFVEMAKSNKVVAFGEIGLDFYYDRSERSVQEKVFKEQLELADYLKLPVVLHIRDAYQLAYDILKEASKLLNNGVVLHCYSGSAEMAKRFADFDAYFSFGGAITFKNSNKEEVVNVINKDRLLLETDCPYMTPHPFRGKTNYPKYIKFVAQKMQEWFPNINIPALTTNNAKRVFRI